MLISFYSPCLLHVCLCRLLLDLLLTCLNISSQPTSERLELASKSRVLLVYHSCPFQPFICDWVQKDSPTRTMQPLHLVRTQPFLLAHHHFLSDTQHTCRNNLTRDPQPIGCDSDWDTTTKKCNNHLSKAIPDIKTRYTSNVQTPNG